MSQLVEQVRHGEGMACAQSTEQVTAGPLASYFIYSAAEADIFESPIKATFFESSTTAGSYCKFAAISPHSNVRKEIRFTGAVKAAS